MDLSPSTLLVLAFAALSLVVIARLRRRSTAVRHLDAQTADKEAPLSNSNGAADAAADAAPPDYAGVFPPSARDGLLRVAAASATRPGLHFSPTIATDALETNLIGWETDWRTCDDDKVLPSSITVGEVRQLGDFPDYAALSGVPLPCPYEGFDLAHAQHRPYRPFRWAYHQTMSLTRMEPDWWLELESSYRETMEQRTALLAAHGKQVLDQLPGAELATKEVMEMALQFYAARYPALFALEHSADRGWVFHNRILGSETVLRDHEPLRALAAHVPEDFGIVMRNPADGRYYLRSAVICSALGWNVASKLGMPLASIHEPIPMYRAKMEFSMDRFFAKMPASKPIQRGSWGLEVDRPLYMPPGDPHEKHRLTQNPDLTLDRCHLRVDWQTLRRLPLSGAIVFNFKAVFTPVTEFRDEPGVPELVHTVLTHGDKSIMQYKNTWHTEHVVVPMLEQWAREQREKGLVDKDWEVQTLQDSPFFVGWEEKWRRQQGF